MHSFGQYALDEYVHSWHIDRNLEYSESENKKLPSQGIGISDECVYDHDIDQSNVHVW